MYLLKERYQFSFIITIGLIASSCLQTPHTTEQPTHPAVQLQADTAFRFTPSVPPPQMTTPLQRANYIAQQYWNGFNFNVKIHRATLSQFEQTGADFLGILSAAAPDTAIAAIKKSIIKTGDNKELLLAFGNFYNKYLHHPNSPLKNDVLYAAAAESIVAANRLSPQEKMPFIVALEVAKKNNTGTVADDFTFTTADGRKHSLHKTSAAYTLLIFYDPTCHICTQVLAQMAPSAPLHTLISEKKITVLAVYPYENKATWADYMPNIPTTWINGWDDTQMILKQNRYDLRALPAIYLLDSKKNVVLKDVPFETALQYLQSAK